MPCILSLLTRVTSLQDGILITDRIVNETIIKVAQKNQVPLDNPQFIFISQKFRQAALEVLPKYHLKIIEHPSQAKALVAKAGQVITKRVESNLLQKRFVFSLMKQILQQMVIIATISLLINIFITGPELKIREWYCKDHPCEPDDYYNQ